VFARQGFLWLKVIAFNVPNRALSEKTNLPMLDIDETDDPATA
jgi:hypothetical protein